MEDNFFAYQRRALRPLLAWGIGSSVGGALMLLVPGAARHFGVQAAAWGVIDVLLAIAGRRRALLKAEELAHGDLDEAAAAREAEGFQRLLALNAWLDLLYIAAGLAVAARWRDRPDRRGLGLGVAVQGLFLLVFDALLARDIDRRFLR
ncbi:MAG TPA: hypothetical protein PKD53_08075 [Chloroflexaceae bacterium]|nr:hypothetical protein [Chloroflexaceae bacterium]